MSEDTKVVNAVEENNAKSVEDMKAEFKDEKETNGFVQFFINHKKAIIVGTLTAVGTAVLAGLAMHSDNDEEPELVADYKPEELDSTDESTTTEDKTEE